jgi:hypothetical protein
VPNSNLNILKKNKRHGTGLKFNEIRPRQPIRIKFRFFRLNCSIICGTPGLCGNWSPAKIRSEHKSVPDRGYSGCTE